MPTIAVNPQTLPVDWQLPLYIVKNGNLAPEPAKELKVSSKTSLEIDINLPNFCNAPKAYLGKVFENLPTSISAATIMMGARIAKGSFNIVSGNIVLGMLVGGTVSRAVRSILHQEQNVTDPFEAEGFKEMIDSRPFQSGVLTAASLGALAATSSILISSAPVLAAGVAVHYTVERLDENDWITQEQKETIQKVSAIATAAVSLVYPIESIFSLSVGAVIGAVIETYQVHAMDTPE